MFEETDPLADTLLVQLLECYGEPALVERETWRERVGDLQGATARELSRLHGELIAQGWIEQNTGVTPACYRVTVQGLRAYRKVREETCTEVVG